MTTAGDPAPTTIEPRTPTPYRVIGAGTLAAAAILIIVLSAIVGGNPDAATMRTALALATLLLFHTGLWALTMHRSQVLHDLTEQAAVARFEQIRRDIRDLGIQTLRNSGKSALADMAIRYEQMIDRLDRIAIMLKSAEAREADLTRRLLEVETLLAAVSSPNVFDLSAIRDAKVVQQKIDDDQ